MADTGTPLEQWDVPDSDGQTTRLIAMAGLATVVVGANGAGKSALGWRLEQTGRNVKRLLAHRKLWFETPGPDVASSQREKLSTNFKSWSLDAASRYLDHGNTQRTGVVIFDLIARYNFENAQLAEQVRGGVGVPREVAKSVFERLNVIFAGAKLPLSFSLTEQSTIQVLNSARGAAYPISQMSDGEKSALLLAAEILSSPADITFIIDEPERHLHRSISAGLVAAVMTARSDAHFVILTHDLDLAKSLPEATTAKYVLNDCAWQGQSVVSWDLHAVDPTGTLPDDARRSVLGGRTQMLFLEGGEASLDSGLYGLLYPGLTLTPVGSCDRVVRAVGGIRDSAEHHWLEAVGIIDADGRQPEEIATLNSRGILVLPVSEIESVYFMTPVLKAVAERQAESLGLKATQLHGDAITAALKALGQGDAPQRLAASVAEKIIYRKATERLPDRATIATGATTVTVEIDSPYRDLLKDYTVLLADNDFEGLLGQFPIRDTSARNAVANALHFKSFADYQAVVLTRLRADAGLALQVRDVLGPLPLRPVAA